MKVIRSESTHTAPSNCVDPSLLEYKGAPNMTSHRSELQSLHQDGIRWAESGVVSGAKINNRY